MWYLEDDSAVPPLPSSISPTASTAPATLAAAPGGEPLRLRSGCWLVKLDPEFSDDYELGQGSYSYFQSWVVCYLGTLRIEQIEETPDESSDRERPAIAKRRAQARGESGSLRGSGDLYVQRQLWYEAPPSGSPPRLRHRRTVPIFPRRDYAYYFTIVGIESQDGGLHLRLATHRFQAADKAWGETGLLTAHLKVPDPVPKKWQAPPGSYFRGPVFNERGTRIGDLELGWISDFLRRAAVEIDAVEGLRVHLDNGEGVTLKEIFGKVGWDLFVKGPETVPNEHGDVWGDSVLHARMLDWRATAKLDDYWLYHVLVVPRLIRELEYGWGRMYDQGAIDVNLVPREGVVVAARSKFPDEPESYGSAAGQFLEDVPSAFFHALVHELGHAMGLSHRLLGAYFMQGLVYVAESPDTTFPDDLQWRFHPEDAYRLRHYPDIYVRPGGVAFEKGYSYLPVPELDAVSDVSDAFELTVVPGDHVLPLGAPLRIHLRLTNKWSIELPAPNWIAFSEGTIAGRVIGPGFQVHRFVTAKRINGSATGKLLPGESRYHAETLLRGPRGALLPSPGRYTLQIDAFWRGPAGVASVSASTDLLVVAPGDLRHAEAALALLGSRELANTLIFQTPPERLTHGYRGRVQAGVDALRLALEVADLRPFFAVIEAKRLAEQGECWMEKAAGWIESTSVATAMEIEHLVRQIRDAGQEVRGKSAVRRMIAIFRVKAEELVALDLASTQLLSLIESVQTRPGREGEKT